MARSVLKLVIEDEDGGRMEIPLEQDELTIGRDASNHVQLRDRNISRHHCRLFRSGDGLLIEDLQSSNGLAVNGDMMTGRRPVQVGDRIEIGDYRILIEDESAAVAVGSRAAPDLPGQAAAPQKRTPTPIPRFPGLPKDLDVTPGPPRPLASRQPQEPPRGPAKPEPPAQVQLSAKPEAPAQVQPTAKPDAPAQVQPTAKPEAPGPPAALVDGRFTPGPRLAPLPSMTPGPAAAASFEKTPGPLAPLLAITPGPSAAFLANTPGPGSAGLSQTPGPAASFDKPPGPGAAGHTNTPGPGITPSVSATKESSRLVILSGELAGTSIALPREAAWLGSDPAADLVLPHPSVALRHCRIEPLASRGYRVVRASPEAELSVNGISSNEAFFRSDDLIRIGSVLLRFVEGGR